MRSSYFARIFLFTTVVLLIILFLSGTVLAFAQTQVADAHQASSQSVTPIVTATVTQQSAGATNVSGIIALTFLMVVVIGVGLLWGEYLAPVERNR